MRMTRTLFSNSKHKPREVSSDAEATTLNPSQIAKFCDVIAKSAGDIADYQSNWEKTDKAQENILRKLDEILRDGVQDIKDDENNTDKNKERSLRTLASATTNFTRRIGGIPAQISGFALPVYAATLNWCEGSMRNYKK